MVFLGIDFGWQSQPSGLAALVPSDGALHLSALDRLSTIDEILDWTERHGGPDAVAAVDAPIVIANPTGMREADREAHRRYGRYHAGCYPANLSRPHASRTLELASRLEAAGFQHAPAMPPRAPGRWQFECHPHAATVQLFALDRIIKYKKGRRVDRSAGLARLRAFQLDKMRWLDPPLVLDELPPIPERGLLKPLEDKLDAITCAYIAAHWWHWGRERNDVLGNRSDGYIIVPQRSIL
jgi:predicted RNase H-like nuclease